LTDEFSNQGNMELELNIPTQLFGGPPVRDNVVKMGESQIGFMNIFARPLFESVTDILPAMQFSVDEILNNKAIWQQKIDEEKQRQHQKAMDGLDGFGSSLLLPQTPGTVDGMMSPMSGSHVDLPGTNPVTSPTSTGGQGKAKSTDEGTPRTFLTKPSPTTGSPVDKKKKEKFSSRLRSVSPSKRKSKNRDRSSSKHDPLRPRTSPQNNDYDGTTNGVPKLPHQLSQPDIRYPQMNGHVVPPVGSVGSDEMVNKVYSSGTDMSSGTPGKNRMSRFGFGKLFKKRFRTTSASQTPSPNSKSIINDRAEGT
jgi:hypothetical protein